MKPFLYPVLRFVLRPVIRFIRWVLVQNSYLDNERLRFKLNAIDPATLAIYGNVVIVHPERCAVGHHVSIHDADWNAEGEIHIGNYVHFGHNVSILTASRNYEGEHFPTTAP